MPSELPPNPSNRRVDPRRSFDTQAEEQIQNGYAAGQFDNLPGYGQRLPFNEEPPDEDWWIKEKLKREEISILPPSLEILRDVEKTLSAVARMVSEQAVRREITVLNERIRDANMRSVWGPPSTQMPLDVEEVVRRWREK